MSESGRPAEARLAHPGSLVVRLAQYQRVRFPLAAYLPLIALAAFGAIAYSRVSRGAAGFVSGGAYLVTAATLLAGFFILRVADEHKDAEADRAYRSHLPVPSGLVTLRELRFVALMALATVTAANALLDPRLLLLMALVAVWIALMTREFFVREWLRARPVPYLLSHMCVMPLLFLYAAAVDWVPAGSKAPALGAFLGAVFASGLVLEIGRKIRTPEEEREGVETYSARWGERAAVLRWGAAVGAAGSLVALAGVQVASVWAPPAAFAGTLLVALAAVPALRAAAGRSGKTIEVAGGIWNLLAFALLALPWLERRI